MAADADLFKAVRFQLLLLKEGTKKSLWEKSYVQWGLCWLCWINCISKTFLPEPRFKKALGCREYKPLPHTSKSEEAPDPPWNIVSFLPFMRNLAQDVALQRNRRWNDHKVKRCLAKDRYVCFRGKGKGSTLRRGNGSAFPTMETENLLLKIEGEWPRKETWDSA